MTPNWIRVEDRLPKDRQRVHTYCPCAYNGYKVDIHTYHANYRNLGPWWIGGNQNYNAEDGYITHWAELMEGPKDGEE